MNLRKEEGLKQKVRLATLTLIEVTQITQGCTIGRLRTQIKSNRSQIGIFLESEKKENQILEKQNQVLEGFVKSLESHQQIFESHQQSLELYQQSLENCQSLLEGFEENRGLLR